MPQELITVRASSLSGYLDCPRREAAKNFRSLIEAYGYKLRQLDRGIAASVGTAVHAGASYTLQSKMDTGSLGNKTESDQRALDSLNEEISGGVVWDETTQELNTAQQQVIRMNTCYRTDVAPRVKPASIENRLEGETMGVILSGQSDVREADNIRDTKTGAKPRYHGAQVGGYSLLARAHGENITKAYVDFIKRGTIRKDQEPAQEIEYDAAAAEQLATAVLGRIQRDHQDFLASNGNPDSFLPNPSSMLCSDKYCPAHSTAFCPHHTKKAEEE